MKTRREARAERGRAARGEHGRGQAAASRLSKGEARRAGRPVTWRILRGTSGEAGLPSLLWPETAGDCCGDGDARRTCRVRREPSDDLARQLGSASAAKPGTASSLPDRRGRVLGWLACGPAYDADEEEVAAYEAASRRRTLTAAGAAHTAVSRCGLRMLTKDGKAVDASDLARTRVIVTRQPR